LSDRLCHLCGAESVSAAFTGHTDADGDPYTPIHAHGHLDLCTYLDADLDSHADGHGDAQRNGYAHSNGYTDCNRDPDHGSADGYCYPVALAYLHRVADGYIHYRSPYAYADTAPADGDALGHRPTTLASFCLESRAGFHTCLQRGGYGKLPYGVFRQELAS
jgi:hypothetical protein